MIACFFHKQYERDHSLRLNPYCLLIFNKLYISKVVVVLFS